MGEQARGLFLCSVLSVAVASGGGIAGIGGGAGCKSSDDEPTRVLSGGESAIVIEQGGRSVKIQERTDVKLTFAADGFQLGFVTDYNDTTSYDPYWLEHTSDGSIAEPSPDVEWRSPTTFRTVVADAGHITVGLEYQGALVDVALELVSPGSFKATMTIKQNGPEPIALVRLHAHTANDPNEGFYGLGEQEDSVDNRKTLRAMQLETDGAVESKYNEAHVPIPFLVGSHGWGVFVEDKRVGLFDVARKADDIVEITYGTGPTTTTQDFVFHLYSEPRPLDIEKHYFEDTGYPRLPALWALGPFLWRNDVKGETQVRSDIAMTRMLHLPTSAMWIDRPYSTKIGSFDFDPANYTNPTGMIQLAQSQGFRMGLWHVPYVEMGAEPYRTTAEQNYFPTQPGILFQSWSPPIDFTATGATAFWRKSLKPYIDIGIEGFKLDYGEDVAPTLPLGGRNVWKFHDGTDERTAHYDYTRAFHDAYQGALPDQSFLLCRAGRWGDQKSASIIWPGDMDSTFTKHGESFTDANGMPVVGVGGLPATVVQNLSLGVSGFPFFASDTGGYRHSPPDNELYIRWFEQTALSVVMEVGDGSSEMPWEFTADNGRTQATLDLYKQYASLHMQLFPYAWTEAWKLSTFGHAILQPVGLAFPEVAVHPSDEYLFGDDLLVAPVVSRGTTNRMVVFPPGEWIDWWDGTIYPGPVTATVPCPLERIPLFLRATGAIPMLRSTIETLSPVTDPKSIDSFAADPGVLGIRFAPRATAPTNLDVFDGTHMDATLAAPTITVNLKAGGNFNKGYRLELVSTPAPVNIVADGATLVKAASLAALDASTTSGYFTAPATGGTVWIKLPAGATTVTITEGTL